MSDQPQPHDLVPKECASLPQPDFAPPNPVLAEYQAALADKGARVYPEDFMHNGRHVERKTVITAGQSFTSNQFLDGRLTVANSKTQQTDYYKPDGKTRDGMDWLATEADGKVKQFSAFLDDRGQIYSEHVNLFNSMRDFQNDPNKPLIDAAYNFEDSKTSFCGEDSPTGIKRLLFPGDND